MENIEMMILVKLKNVYYVYYGRSFKKLWENWIEKLRMWNEKKPWIYNETLNVLAESGVEYMGLKYEYME